MPRPPIRTIAIALALVASTTAFGQAADRIEGPVPEEVEAYKQAAARFTARATEMRDDTLAFVELRENEEKEKLTSSYDRLLDDLAEREKNQRDTTIARFNDFLSKYPNSEYASHVRFRLADLYFEVENEAWLERSRVYFEKLNRDDLSLEEAEQLESEGQPKLDLARPVALYKRIIADNRNKPDDERYERLDGVYLMLGFIYSEENAALPERDYPKPLDPEDPEYDEDAEPFDPANFEQVRLRKNELANATFRELIDQLPDSDLADRAHLFLGNFLFDEGQFEEAIAEYELVYAKGEEGPYFDDAVYQLAWTHYKLDDYDNAVPRFTEVLDRSVEQEAETGNVSPFKMDSIRYMAFSFADQGNADGNALGVAQEYFTRIGEREYEHDIYVELADVLDRYVRWGEAVDVYKNLQNDPRWVHHPDNPKYQMAIVRLYGNPLKIGDLEASGEERLQLTGRYNEGSEWWDANRNNPDALATARGYIESSLNQVATELRVRAQNTEDPADYMVAAEKYQEYLDKFPISDDYYDTQWLLADSLRRGGARERAVEEFEKLIRSAAYHPYLDGALVYRLQARNEQLNESAPPDQLPDGAVVEKTYTTEAGKELSVYEVGELQAEFIESADAVLAHDFGEPEVAEVPDFRDFISENRHKLMYIPAQILFYHNRYDEARPRLEAVIDQYPRKDEASYAASLLVNSYKEEGDLAQVRKYTKRFSTEVLGTADVPDPEGKFRSLLEGTAFTQAKNVAESGDSIAAAEAFMQFLADFPDSEHKEFSLYNAAFYYQQGGRAERANELYEEFLAKYPDHEYSEKLYFRVASLYESTLQLDKAVDYYRALAKQFPENEDTPNAIYNAAFLQIGLGRPRAAAEGLEAYGTEFADQDDAEKVFFEAGEQWEAVSERDGLRFYDRYLQRYGYENPENALTAMARKADIYQAQGNTRSYERQLDEILAAFDQLKGEGKDVGPRGEKYAARAAFRELEEAFEEYTTGELVQNEDKDLALIDEKKATLKAFEEQAKAFSAKFSDFEYSSKALLYLGLAPSYLADLGLSIECPKGVSEDDCFLYFDVLEEKVFPQFRKIQSEIVIPRLTGLIDKAEELKRHSEAVDDARKELNRINPVDYPAVKRELEGETDSSAPPPVSGVAIPDPEEAEAEEEE
jgi:TolA-binding protein